MKKRPNYGSAKPEDLARALLRPLRPRTRTKPVLRDEVSIQHGKTKPDRKRSQSHQAN